MTFNGIAVLHTDERTFELIAAHGPGKLTHDEIAIQLNLSRATVYRSVKRLVNAGYMTRSGRGRHGSRYQVVHAND